MAETGATALFEPPPTPPSRRTGETTRSGLESRNLAYNPALDGIRAVAVLAVLFWHATVWWAPGGFLGVDIFFVLSGYLITTLLLVEHDRSGHIALKAFWIRRARRLLPALFAVVAVVALYAMLAASSLEIPRLRGDAIASLFFVANWRFVATGQSYFESLFGVPSPLRHTWSLAIEEQFYLIWPLIVAFGFRVRHMARWAAGLGVVAIASALLMAALVDDAGDPSRVYYGTDTRVQALALGAAMAFLLRRWPVQSLMPRWALQALTICGTVVTVGMLFVVGEKDMWMYRGGFLLVALGAATMVLAAVTTGPGGTVRDHRVGPRAPWRQNRLLAPIGAALDVVTEPGAPWVRRALAVPPLPQIGKISYGLYLWHWPIYLWLSPERTGLDGDDLLHLRLAVTFGVATLSYFALERPVRLGALRRLAAHVAPSQPGRLVAIASAVLALVLMGSVVLVTRETATAGEGTVRALITGDSVPYTFFQGVAAGNPGEQVQLSNGAIIGCGFMTTRKVNEDPTLAELCRHRDEIWSQTLADRRPDVAVMMPGGYEVFDQVDSDGRTLTFGTPEFAQRLQNDLGGSVDKLRSTGARAIILTAPCYREKSPYGQHPERTDDSRTAWLNTQIRQFATANPGKVSLIDLAGFTCPNGTWQETVDGVKLQDDGVHFTKEGAQLVWRWLEPQVAAQTGR